MPAVRELFIRFGIQLDEKKLKELERALEGAKAKAAGAGSALRQFGGAAKFTASSIAVAGAAISAAAVGMFEFVRRGFQAIDTLDELSQGAGLSVAVFGQLSAVFQRAGVDQQQLAIGIKNLSLKMQDAREGGKESRKMFKDLGVDFSGPVDDAILNIADRFKGLTDPVKKAQLAADVFGARIGIKMVPALNDGSRAIIDLGRKAIQSGAVPTEVLIATQRRWEATLGDLALTLTGIKNRILQEVGPSLILLIERFTSVLTSGDTIRVIVGGIGLSFKFLIHWLGFINEAFKVFIEYVDWIIANAGKVGGIIKGITGALPRFGEKLGDLAFYATRGGVPPGSSAPSLPSGTVAPVMTVGGAVQNVNSNVTVNLPPGTDPKDANAVASSVRREVDRLLDLRLRGAVAGIPAR